MRMPRRGDIAFGAMWRGDRKLREEQVCGTVPWATVGAYMYPVLCEHGHLDTCAEPIATAAARTLLERSKGATRPSPGVWRDGGCRVRLVGVYTRRQPRTFPPGPRIAQAAQTDKSL